MTTFPDFLEAVVDRFLEIPLGGSLCHLWLQRHPKWEAVGVIVGAISQDPVFSISDNPYNEITPFSSSGGTPKSIFCWCFCEGRVWEASGHQFVSVLVDFGVPWEGHLAPKWGPETESKKLAEKCVLGKCMRKSLGPLKGEKDNGRRPGGHQAGGQRSIGRCSR